MTKQIILIFAVLCSVQVQANSRYTERDTVQHEFFHDATELFQPLQPVYLDGVVVPRTGSGNWFVSVTGGATAFLGTPLGCEDLFGRVKPSYNLAVGKWFTPDDLNVDKTGIKPDQEVLFDRTGFDDKAIDNQLEAAKVSIRSLIQ